MNTLHIGMLLFPELTQLDLTAPFEMFHRLPGARVHLVGTSMEPVRSDSGLTILPTTTLDDCPPVDLLFVPGGYGQIAMMEHPRVLAWLQREGARARWVTSVCTGSLLLGAAGLLKGYRATTHWAYTDLLAAYGATYTTGRVVVDGNRITAGGVTAGIDFGLRVLAEIAGEDAAKQVQLALEYDPAPPFACGHPRTADPEVVQAVRAKLAERIARRREQAVG